VAGCRFDVFQATEMPKRCQVFPLHNAVVKERMTQGT